MRKVFIKEPESLSAFCPCPELGQIVEVFASEKYPGFYRVKNFETHPVTGRPLYWFCGCFAEPELAYKILSRELAQRALDTPAEIAETGRIVFTTKAKF